MASSAPQTLSCSYSPDSVMLAASQTLGVRIKLQKACQISSGCRCCRCCRCSSITCRCLSLLMAWAVSWSPASALLQAGARGHGPSVVFKVQCHANSLRTCMCITSETH